MRIFTNNGCLHQQQPDHILPFNDANQQQWDSFVLASNYSSCYHLIGWKRVIEQSFGHNTFYLLSKNGSGSIEGILPLVQLKSHLFGNFLVSLPYFNYGGVCASNQEVRNQLLEEAKFLATEIYAEYIEIRQTKHLYEDLPVKTTKVAMRLNLPSDTETLFKNFPTKLRSQIKKPQKDGMIAKMGRIDRLDQFYTVFSQNMRDLGTPVYARSFFRNILEIFPDNTWICTVSSKNGLPVAAGFLVGFKDTLEIPWASSLRKYNYMSPNMLLYWNVLKFACEKGYQVFDFGRSTPGEGTYRFKEQWGAKPIPIYWNYWLSKGGKLPEINPKNPKYHLAIQIWKKMPVFLTRLIGPYIVKSLP